MKINNSFIKQQFQNIISTHRLNVAIDNDYHLKLENDLIELDFATERRDDGITISLVNKLNNEFYDPLDIEEKKGYTDFDSTLSSANKAFFLSLKEGNDKIVFSFKVLLEIHCQDALKGDFSSLGQGNRSY